MVILPAMWCYTIGLSLQCTFPSLEVCLFQASQWQGKMKVIAIKIWSLLLLSVTVHSPTRSTRPVSHSVKVTFLGGKFPYFLISVHL